MLIPPRTQCIKCLYHLISDYSGTMRCSTGNDRSLTGAERDRFAGNRELNVTREHIGDLLFGMLMLGEDGARLVDIAHHCLSFGVHSLASDARIYLSCGNGGP